MYCKRSLTVLTSVLLLSACTSTGQDSEKNRIEDKGSKSEVTLDSIGFNTEGWKKLDSTNARVDWQIDNSQILSKEYFAVPPEIPHNLDKLKEIREMYRAAVTSSGGGLVSVDVIKIHTLPVIKTIFKFPQKPSGMAYVGSLTLPLENFSFVIKVQAKEAGATGMRDALVLEKMIGEGKIEPMETGQMKGWAQDPYEPAYRGAVMRNLSEDEKYDSEFPDHPLSRLRKTLDRVEQSMTIDAAVRDSEAFSQVLTNQ